MQEFVPVNLDSVLKKDSIPFASNYVQTEKIIKLLGVPVAWQYELENNGYFNVTCENQFVANIKNYDFFISDFSFYDQSISKNYLHDSILYTVSYTKGLNKIFIHSPLGHLSLNFNSILDSIYSTSAKEQFTLPAKSMTFESIASHFSAKLIITRLSGTKEHKNHSLTQFSAVIFIKEND